MRQRAGSVIVICALVAGSGACAPPAERPAAPALSGRIVDLSHAFDEETIYWPTADRFQLEVVDDGVTAGGYYYAANNFATAEHGGTHLDAPRHFAEGHWTADEIPVDRFVGPAVVVDVSSEAAEDADYQITVGDLQAWEMAHGAIPAGAIVLFRTGFSDRWPNAASYLGTSERGDAGVAGLHFPGLHPDAATWLVAERAIDAVGIDTASIDFGQSSMFESHRVLFERDVPAFENLDALDQLPPTGATVVALPMKIGGGSGAPLRAIAFVPER